MRVVILGAGYAGLTVVRRLERTLPSSVEFVLVDESDRHLLQHELHRVVRRPALEDVITVPLTDVVSRADVRQARVTALDPERQVVTLAAVGDGNEDSGDGEWNGRTDDEAHETLSYDVAAVCLGSQTAFAGLDSVAEHALPLKRLDHAHEIRSQALATGEGGVVVGGAGFSGVQVAGELAALSAEADLGLDVTVVEVADRIAPTFDATFAEALRRELESREVTVETGVAVEAADEETVTLADGRTLSADVFVWTGGIRGPDALGGERMSADADLRVGDATFVVGDAGRIIDDTGVEAPASAQTAVRQARIAARNIRQFVEVADYGERGDDDEDADSSTEGPGGDSSTNGSDETHPEFDTYRFDAPGWVVTVGDGAVAHIGPVVMSGEPAKAAKAAIGAGHLGSVGAISRASDLVAEELGWPTGSSFDLSGPLEKQVLAALPTDPASPSELQYPLANLAFSLVEPFSPDDPVDLTELTGRADLESPERALKTMQRSLSDALDLAVTFGTLGKNRETSGETDGESDPEGHTDV